MEEITLETVHVKPKELFLAALQKKAVEHPAAGSATSVVTTDLMEEVGAFFPKAHTDAEEMAKLAEAGHSVLGFDNVMPLFSVWHESAALGCRVDWGRRDLMPDSKDHPFKVGDEIAIPNNLEKQPSCRVPLEAIGLLKKRLGNEVAVVGKVFGPWTLAYHMFGVETFLMATLLDPDSVRRSMEMLKEVTVRFGLAQIEAGADALTLADHCTRDLCSPDAYRDFVKDIHTELVERLPVPIITHICGDTSDRIQYVAETGVASFHFDSKVPTAKARELAGNNMALMGGTSNFDVIRTGTPEGIAADVLEKKRYKIDVIGPECAVPLDAPWRNMRQLVEAVHRP